MAWFFVDNLSSCISVVTKNVSWYGAGHSNRRQHGIVKRKGSQALESGRSVFKSWLFHFLTVCFEQVT